MSSASMLVTGLFLNFYQQSFSDLEHYHTTSSLFMFSDLLSLNASANKPSVDRHSHIFLLASVVATLTTMVAMVIQVTA
jgi:hypothetical protein